MTATKININVKKIKPAFINKYRYNQEENNLKVKRNKFCTIC